MEQLRVTRGELYLKAASVPVDDDVKRAAALLHIAGGEVHNLYTTTLSNNPVAARYQNRIRQSKSPPHETLGRVGKI